MHWIERQTARILEPVECWRKSANPDDQKPLEETPLAYVVPDDSSPYAAVIINKFGGNKLDYCLKRGIEYAANGCSGKTRDSTVTMKLNSAVPPGLPDFLATSNGLVRRAPINVPLGTMLKSIRLIATKGAVLKSAFANAQRVPVIRAQNSATPPSRTGGHTARKIMRTDHTSHRADGIG